MHLKNPTMEDVRKYVSVDLTHISGWRPHQENDSEEIAVVKKEEGANNIAEMSQNF